MTNTKQGPEFKLTTDTPYLTLSGELWVSVVKIKKKMPCYSGTTLYE